MFQLSQRSENNLKGVHPDLVKLVRAALAVSPYDFGITQGLRTKAEQEKNVAAGKSQTMSSRHLTGHAVDFVVYIEGAVNWEWSYYAAVAEAFKAEAKKLGIAIVWGGDWKTLKDGPHIELARSAYP